MTEPAIGDEVTGTVPETGQVVQGMYLGSFAWNRVLDRPEYALLSVDGRRFAVLFDSLEVLPSGG